MILVAPLQIEQSQAVSSAACLVSRAEVTSLLSTCFSLVAVVESRQLVNYVEHNLETPCHEAGQLLGNTCETTVSTLSQLGSYKTHYSDINLEYFAKVLGEAKTLGEIST